MSRRKIKRMAAAALSFLLGVCLAVSAFAQEENNAKTGGTAVEEKAGTQVWAGVSVDYMFPLRYEVYDPNNQPLEGVSIEHYDYNAQEYVYVGRTDENGTWQTKVTAGYFNNVIIGGAQGVSVADTRALYEGNGELRHRISKDGFLIVEGVADYTIETDEKGEQVIVIRITMQYDTPQSSSVPNESPSSQPATPESAKPTSTTTPAASTGGRLPQTGVPSYWIFLAIGSLLLLLAALIIYQILRDEKKNRTKNATGGKQE